MLAQYLVVKALFGAQPELRERTGGCCRHAHTAHFQCLNAAIREDSSCSVHAAAQHLVFYFWCHRDFFLFIFWIAACRSSHFNWSTWFRNLLFTLLEWMHFKNAFIPRWLLSLSQNWSWSIMDEGQLLLLLMVEQKKRETKRHNKNKENDLSSLRRNVILSCLFLMQPAFSLATH